MAMIWDAIVYLVYFEIHKLETLQTLQQIELHMISSHRNFMVAKTTGLVLSILGTVAAPFTGGLSLVGTVVGAGISIGSTIGESNMLKFLGNKAQKELEHLDATSTKIQILPIDWEEVSFTLKNLVVEDEVPISIREMLPEASRDILSKIPEETFIKILISFKEKITSFFGKFSIEDGESTTRLAAESVAKEITSEAAAHLSKEVGKKVIFSSLLIGIAVAIDMIDLINIWKAGDPKALNQIRDVIENLKFSIVTSL